MKIPSLTCIEDTLWIVDEPVGLSKYDFDFSAHFDCTHPAWLDAPIEAVARMGAAPDYAARHEWLEGFDIRLVHTPDDYALSSTLPRWYPLVEEWTPRSIWFDEHPDAAAIEERFDYPVFLKGERQTNRHSRDHSIIEDGDQLRRVLAEWRARPILGWQRVVCREFLRLRPVAQDLGVGLPKVFEFRTFWWRGQCVGIGPYWSNPRYEASAEDERAMRALGERVVARVPVTFLVIDMAQTIDGDWIVIECNDGQDSGYMGVDRVALWRNVLEIERQRSAAESNRA